TRSGMRFKRPRLAAAPRVAVVQLAAHAPMPRAGLPVARLLALAGCAGAAAPRSARSCAAPLHVEPLVTAASAQLRSVGAAALPPSARAVALRRRCRSLLALLSGGAAALRNDGAVCASLARLPSVGAAALRGGRAASEPLLSVRSAQRWCSALAPLRDVAAAPPPRCSSSTPQLPVA
ncbi:unnamed protein product, partial [Prorocentrum cordatum]